METASIKQIIDHMISEVMDGECPKKVIKKQFPKGLSKVMSRIPEVHFACPKCGMEIPVYPGRYPAKCPECGESFENNEITKSKNIAKCKEN